MRLSQDSEAKEKAVGCIRGRPSSSGKGSVPAVPFDAIGSIAIAHIPEALLSEKKRIARGIMAENKRIKSVFRKASAMSGVFRVRELEWLCGEKGTEALYLESGARMKLDVSSSYFSVRLSYERKRIAEQVKDGEKILALFAGVGPFPLVIFRELKAKRESAEIVAVELNPDAFKFLEENIALNKASSSIKPVLGDVNEVVPCFYPNWADRIIMPLPHTGEDFLDSAICGAKSGCKIHFYCFVPLGEKHHPNLEAARELVEKALARNKVKGMILFQREVRPYSTAVGQVVTDFTVLK